MLDIWTAQWRAKNGHEFVAATAAVLLNAWIALVTSLLLWLAHYVFGLMFGNVLIFGRVPVESVTHGAFLLIFARFLWSVLRREW